MLPPMRILGNGSLTFSTVDPFNAAPEDFPVRKQFIFADTAEELESRIETIRAGFEALNAGQSLTNEWRLAFLDIGGAGYGHNFFAVLQWGNDLFNPAQFAVIGALPDKIRIMVFSAASTGALEVARLDANARFARIAVAEGLAPSYLIRQTFYDGASQGTRFMGALSIEVQ